jgi:hypothetical protein
VSCIAPKCRARRELGAVFCRTHILSPAAQRGGWLSAERRRRLRANHPAVALDASNIVRRLWVGGKPPLDRPLPDFDVLVLCAQEIQPIGVGFHGQVLRCPLPDAALDNQELARAFVTARKVGEALVSGKRVLVTCAMGLNRSALVASLGLGLVTRMSADELVRLMRTRRHHDCLSNEHFRAILKRYVGSGRGAESRR